MRRCRSLRKTLRPSGLTKGPDVLGGDMRNQVHEIKTRTGLTDTFLKTKSKGTSGPVRESHPGPLAPKARIIPLDQLAAI